METLEDIWQLSEQRLTEARSLLSSGHSDGAFYLAGYAVELALKWKVCQNFEIPNLFGADTPDIFGVSILKKSVHTHDLRVLMLYSGLWKKFDAGKSTNHTLYLANSLLFGTWSEKCRYEKCGFTETDNVENLLTLLEDADQGLIEWIKNN